MKLFNYIILLMIVCCSQLKAQDTYQNLRKYWYYRDRLKNFVYVSPNYNDPGTNIPAERVTLDANNKQQTLVWDDGNGAFNQYISVLATEYKLLKNSGQDYSQSARELYYALKSFERLDKTAESYLRNGQSLSTDLNGCFKRNDANNTFWNKYKSGGTTPYFKANSYIRGDTNINSLDNCIHFLEAFSLVNALVDDEYVDGIYVNFKQIVRDHTYRIIQNMQHPDEPIPLINFSVLKDIHKYTWYLKDPVTNQALDGNRGGGLDGTMLYACYGFKNAANRILGSNVFNEMNYSYEITKALLSNPIGSTINYTAYNKLDWCSSLLGFPRGVIDVELKINTPNGTIMLQDLLPNSGCFTEFDHLSGNFGPFDDYKVRSLAATGDVNIVSGKSPYQVLVEKQYLSSTYVYEHFPLIWSVLTNNFTYMNNEDRDFVRNLLNIAPTWGPYTAVNNGITTYGNYEWSSTNRLIWPEKRGKEEAGCYNGLDYMLLHNLFWLSNYTYPYNYPFKQHIGIIHLNSGTATNELNCNTPVTLDRGNVNLMAGKKVTLQNGFTVKVSATSPTNVFTARLVKNGFYTPDNPLFYQQVFIGNYPTSSGPSLRTTDKQLENEDNTAAGENSFLVYPNPFTDIVSIGSEYGSGISRIEVYNSFQLVKEFDLKGVPEATLVLDDLEDAVYMLKIINADGSSRNVKVVKQ